MEQWLNVAQKLSVNDKCRIDCSCGSGKTMIVNNNIKTYTAYCFRCNRKEYHYKGQIGLYQTDYSTIENKKVKIELPKDTEPLVSAIGYHASIARKIMYRSQIFEDLWTKFNIGYSDSLRRLVLPVYDSQGELIWYQLRATDKSSIKYMQPSAEKSVCFYAENKGECSSGVVIVEDILSAIKVSTVQSVIALLGTKLNNYTLSKISNFSEAIIWLDGDNAGINGSYDIKKSISLLCEVRAVVTTLDPKKYNSQEIQEILRG